MPLRFTFDINFVGEARILQGELGYMDHQGPSVPVRLTTSSSDAQVGPSKSEPFSGTGQPLLYSRTPLIRLPFLCNEKSVLFQGVQFCIILPSQYI